MSAFVTSNARQNARFVEMLSLLRGDRSVGTSRVCELNPEPLQTVDDWLAAYKVLWKRKLLRLKAHVEEKHRGRN